MNQNGKRTCQIPNELAVKIKTFAAMDDRKIVDIVNEALLMWLELREKFSVKDCGSEVNVENN